MNIKILGKGKNKLRIEFEDESHTLVNLLRKALWNQKADYAAYEKIHPYLDNPVLVLETKKRDPVNVLKAAARDVSNMSKDFKKEFKRAFAK